MQLEVLVQTMKTTFRTSRWAALAAQSLGMDYNERNGSKRCGWKYPIGCWPEWQDEILVYTTMSVYIKEEFVCAEKLSSRSQRRPSYCWLSPERPHRETWPKMNNWARSYSSTLTYLPRPGKPAPPATARR